MDWTEGYLTEGYIFGYFRELSADNLRLACLSAGLAPPASKPLRYLELGYGQGIPINIHAAAAPGEYWGTDFNPTQTAFALSLADAADSGVVLLNDSFSELAARTDLPKFDIIALHGIWTWVSEENHRIIVDIIRRNLEPGGAVYISYNCLPGWAPAAPLRHLVKLYGELASSDVASVEDKLIAGARFTQQVADAGAHYFRDHPNVVEVLNSLIATDPHYLSHEYFTRAWYLMTFSDMARTLGDAKLTFATSATLFEHVDSINFSSQGRNLLASIGNPVLGQSVRDYLVNQQFRRDIFINGPRQLAASERWELLRAEMFVLASNPDDIPMRLITPCGEIKLKEEIYRPLIEALAEENYAPKTLGQLASHGKLGPLGISAIFEALLILTGSNHVYLAREPTAESRRHCSALNRYIYEMARSEGQVNHIASPVTGSGIYVNRTEQLLLLAGQLGKETAADKAAYLTELVTAQGLSFTKDQKALMTSEEIGAALTRDATVFAQKRLPIFKALGII